MNRIQVERHPLAADILTQPVQDLLCEIHGEFEAERRRLLEARRTRQARYDQGQVPAFTDELPEARTDWRVPPILPDIQRRRVEITGPVNDIKMVINMLNAGPEGMPADMAMLDFEDSMKPTWSNVLQGHCNVIGAMKARLSYVRPKSKTEPEKTYQLNPANMAHPMVRVRGLHMDETHVTIDGRPIAAGLFDLVVSASLGVPHLLNRGRTPLYYIPKCEHYLESRWWNAVMSAIEARLGLEKGTLRTTLLIETLPAAFQMEEILFEMRDRGTGLNVGRWDKIFSDIKVLRKHKDRILADRGTIDMLRPWMDNYAQLLIKTCHRHGAYAMGGMSAFTPGKDHATRDIQTKKVCEDKGREAALGHDGCWVSHPYFIAPALKQFKYTNQLHMQLSDFPSRPDLLPQPTGPKTIEGLRKNIRVAVAFVRGWKRDFGCVAFDNLMEDLATLEISRAQVWQWLHHRIALDDGQTVDETLVRKTFAEECARIISEDIADGGAVEPTETKAACAEAVEAFLRPDLASFFGELIPA